jgi:hypothetical protein
MKIRKIRTIRRSGNLSCNTMLLSYLTFKTHFNNVDSYQVMTQAIGQEPLLTTLYPVPIGSRIMGGQEKYQHYLGQGNPG